MKTAVKKKEKEKEKSTARTMLEASWEATRFCFKYAPLRYIVYVGCEAVFTVLPFIVLYNWQSIINTLTGGALTNEVWLRAALYIAIIILQSGLSTLNSFLDKMSYETIDNNIQRMKIEKLTSLDIAKYYDPEYQNAMSVVNDTPGYPYLFSDLINFMKSVIIAVIAVSGVAQSYPIAAVLIVAFMIPTVIINSRNSIAGYRLYRSEEREERKSHYYRDVLTGRGTAAELRLYGYEDLFRGRYESIWKTIYRAHLRLKRKQIAWEVVGRLLSVAGLAVLIGFMLFDIRNGSIAAGDAALYIGLAMTLSGSMLDTCEGFSTFHMNYLQCAGKFQAFLALTSSLDESGTRQIKGIPEIEFRNVSFKYPGSEDYALKNISFTLHSGEKLALVGINGAGKTTLTRLLCRFYDPTDGVILYDGVPAAEYDINSLRGMYGVLFQNSATYTMTLRENITLSDTEADDDKRFANACEMSGVGTVAEKLEKGYDTEIGRLFSETNYQPSGGESQKIGLARAFYKNAEVIILDEPSSALDAQAEDHIFHAFSEMCDGKSAFLISHRLSAVSMADKVALIEGGRLLEFGTHAQLIAQNGRYAELYNMQAETYRKAAITDET